MTSALSLYEALGGSPTVVAGGLLAPFILLYLVAKYGVFESEKEREGFLFAVAFGGLLAVIVSIFIILSQVRS